jgi:hypothetical protein
MSKKTHLCPAPYAAKRAGGAMNSGPTAPQGDSVRSNKLAVAVLELLRGENHSKRTAA